MNKNAAKRIAAKAANGSVFAGLKAGASVAGRVASKFAGPVGLALTAYDVGSSINTAYKDVKYMQTLDAAGQAKWHKDKRTIIAGGTLQQRYSALSPAQKAQFQTLDKAGRKAMLEGGLVPKGSAHKQTSSGSFLSKLFSVSSAQASDGAAKKQPLIDLKNSERVLRAVVGGGLLFGGATLIDKGTGAALSLSNAAKRAPNPLIKGAGYVASGVTALASLASGIELLSEGAGLGAEAVVGKGKARTTAEKARSSKAYLNKKAANKASATRAKKVVPGNGARKAAAAGKNGVNSYTKKDGSTVQVTAKQAAAYRKRRK